MCMFYPDDHISPKKCHMFPRTTRPSTPCWDDLPPPMVRTSGNWRTWKMSKWCLWFSQLDRKSITFWIWVFFILSSKRMVRTTWEVEMWTSLWLWWCSLHGPSVQWFVICGCFMPPKSHDFFWWSQRWQNPGCWWDSGEFWGNDRMSDFR